MTARVGRSVGKKHGKAPQLISEVGKRIWSDFAA